MSAIACSRNTTLKLEKKDLRCHDNRQILHVILLTRVSFSLPPFFFLLSLSFFLSLSLFLSLSTFLSLSFLSFPSLFLSLPSLSPSLSLLSFFLSLSSFSFPCLSPLFFPTSLSPPSTESLLLEQRATSQRISLCWWIGPFVNPTSACYCLLKWTLFLQGTNCQWPPSQERASALVSLPKSVSPSRTLPHRWRATSRQRFEG